MKLHLQSDSAVTLIDNIFIDRYMPAANGEFVKLYLYLLRCATAGREISISSIADFFDHTEKDVRRALSYWEKLDLLRLDYDSSDNITDIVFLCGREKEDRADLLPDEPSNSETASLSYTTGKTEAASAAAPADQQTAPPAAFQETMPLRKDITPARRKELSSQQEIRQILFIAETYLARPLTTTEINALLYFYDGLHFSQDLIVYLLEYCADKGNPGVRYMEKVAQEWYKEGITTVEQAKVSSSMYNKDYYNVFRAMGLGDRKMSPVEKDFIDRWLNMYHFDISLIEEACARTILQIHEPSFHYAERILADWHKNHVKTKADIRKLDEEHAAGNAASKENSSAESSKTTAPSTGKTSRKNSDNRFTRISQRDYDWQKLEKDLLMAQSPKAE